MLIDSTPSHNHILNNDPNLTNYNKVSSLGINTNFNKNQMNQKTFAQQDLTHIKAPLNNHSVSSSISSHSSSSSTSSSSSSSSPGNSSSSTPSSLLCGSSNYNNNNHSHIENDKDYILKSGTKVIRINTKNYNLNRISAVKNINHSLNENKNATTLISNQDGKIRVSSNGSVHSKHTNNNQHPSPQIRNQSVYNSKMNSDSNTNIFSNNGQTKALKVIVKTFSSNENEEKQLKDINYVSNQSASMKNLKEISSTNQVVNNKLGTTCEINYNNLQMALKAATQALEKSKIAASSVFSKNPVNSHSSVNISNAYESNNSSHKKDINNLAINNRNNVSQSQSNIPNLMCLQNDLNKSNQNFVTSSNSINNLNNSTASKSGLISNNSLFQPYAKSLKDVQVNTLSQSSLVSDFKNNSKALTSSGSRMKNSVSGLISGSTASSTVFSNVISSSMSSSFNPIQSKVKNQTSDTNGNRGTGGKEEECVSNRNNSNANSDSNRIFRNTINLIVENNNPAFTKNICNLKKSNNNTNENNEQKIATSKGITNSSSSANIQKKIDLNESDEIDNINITVNLLDANKNFLNKNSSSLSYDNDIHLNNSIGSSASLSHKKNEKLQQTPASSDYENDSISSISKKNKFNIVNSILTAAISNSSLSNNSQNVINSNFSCKSENTSPPEIQNISNSFKINDKKIGIKKDKNSTNVKQSILKRQKSASTEFLNLINPSEEASSSSAKSANTNDSSSNFKNVNNLVEKKTIRYNSPRLSPTPPQIQQISGVLSKSLCSIVHKPQPLKPPINSNIISNSINKEEASPSFLSTGANNSSKSKNFFRNNISNKSLLKNKCVSTTNLKFESLANSSFSLYGDEKANSSFKSIENIKKPTSKVSSKSVSFLNKIEKSAETNENNNTLDINLLEASTNSDNSMDMDEAVLNEMASKLKCPGIEELNEKDVKLENKEIVQTLFKILDAKSMEILDLQSKLKLEIEMHQMCRNHRSTDLIEQLEEEKQIYEQKLNAIRSTFNQQLKIFEQNERNLMQEKLNALQIIYNDLKLNYKKNLEKELKALKLKLNDSQNHAAQLMKQLQNQSKTNEKNKMLSFASTQTINLSSNDPENISNDEINYNSNSSEFIFYVKKLKSENNELKFQLDSERRLFQKEREKWTSSNDSTPKIPSNQHKSSFNLDQQQSLTSRNLNPNFSKESKMAAVSSNPFQQIKGNFLPINTSMVNLNITKQNLDPHLYQQQKSQF